MLVKESWGTEPGFHAFVRLMHMNLTYLRLSRIKFREEAKRLLFKYAEAAKRLIESRWELFLQCCHVQKRTRWASHAALSSTGHSVIEEKQG